MNLLVNILRKVHVIHAVNVGNKFVFHLFELSIGKDGIRIVKCLNDLTLAEITDRKYDTPLILTLSGKGVVSKNYQIDSKELKQIIEQPNDFLFACENIGNGSLRVTFLRRKLYDVLNNEFDTRKLTFVEIRIDGNNNPELEARKAAEEFWASNFGFKEAIIPSMRSCCLLSLMARKILLPVLLVLLVILLANFFVQQNIAEQLKEQQFLAAQTKRNAAQVEKNLDEKQQILDNLANETKYPYAWIADKIASVVPGDVILTELSIQPLKDRIQVNKSVNVEKDKVLIKGKSADPLSVTTFVDSIQAFGVFGAVQLTMHNRDKKDNYLFTLDVCL